MAGTCAAQSGSVLQSSERKHGSWRATGNLQLERLLKRVTLVSDASPLLASSSDQLNLGKGARCDAITTRMHPYELHKASPNASCTLRTAVTLTVARQSLGCCVAPMHHCSLSHVLLAPRFDLCT